MNRLAWKLFHHWPTVALARHMAQRRGTCNSDFHNDYSFA